MTPIPRVIQRLRASRRGSVAVEFALIGPVFLAMLLGLFQIAIALQAYNAVRNLTSDVARYASVQYQTTNNLTNDQLQNYAVARAIVAPYFLNSQDVDATVVDAATQRVAGAREMTLTVTYQVPSVMSLLGMRNPTLTYSRPIFVIST